MHKKLLFIGLIISFLLNSNNLSAETSVLIPLKKPAGFFKGINTDVSAERLLEFNKNDIIKPINNNFLCIIF